ncbi:acyl carrier protein [Candidatus Liberibacter americanus]|uniref:Acyl carrier protein n=1 Tax=Candidatus Liberibacter americanus str. Sao Paulo TaxID=1261131 RepID=U6B8Q5_9HYPH|nr:acyl carrier protein [Candidatus Liberibacter americanus]AHA28226.1 Acyl carrier protein [Candidatus Liberibacter americanus str. Sao Paulo]EMS36260.1 Acyl carrier protein [Candidatus Liberibacter americanus PW_SP]
MTDDVLLNKTDDALEKNVLERVKSMVSKQLTADPSQVVLNARFIEDLGADSLDTVELVMAFEEEFSLDISEEAANKIMTVGDAVKFITHELQNKK